MSTAFESLSAVDFTAAGAPDVTVIAPDTGDLAGPAESAASGAQSTLGAQFGALVQTTLDGFTRAQHAEAQVAAGQGSLLEMSVERARADAVLNILTAATSRVATDVSTFTNMAV